MRRPFASLRYTTVVTLPMVWGWLLGHVALAQEGSGVGPLPDSMPARVAMLFLPPMIGMLAICFLKANRRERDKPESYQSVRLAEMHDGPKQERRLRPQRKGPEMHPDAQTALTLSIVGILFPPLCIAGIFKGVAAKKRIASDRRLLGEGTALAAIIVGIAGIALWMIGVAVLVVILLL